MRITAGTFRGREVKTPKEARPTSSRLREAVFNICGSIEGATWLDLFSGSGIMAFEALSRGAKSATLVDHSPAAKKAILTNAEKLGVKEQITFLKMDVFQALGRVGQFDLIYADPPYCQGFGEKVLLEVENRNLLLSEGRLLIEEGESLALSPSTLSLVKERKYGGSFLHIFE